MSTDLKKRGWHGAALDFSFPGCTNNVRDFPRKNIFSAREALFSLAIEVICCQTLDENSTRQIKNPKSPEIAVCFAASRFYPRALIVSTVKPHVPSHADLFILFLCARYVCVSLFRLDGIENRA